MANDPRIKEEDIPPAQQGIVIDPLGAPNPYQMGGGIAGGIMKFLTAPGVPEALAAMTAKALGSKHPGRAGQLVSDTRERSRQQRSRQVQQQLAMQRNRREAEQTAMARKRLALEEERHRATMEGLVWVGDDGNQYATRESVPIGVNANPMPAQQAQMMEMQKQQAGLQSLTMWDRLNQSNQSYTVPAQMMESAGLEPVDMNVVNGVVIDPVNSLPAHLKAQYQGEELPPMQMQQYVAWVASLNRGLMYSGMGGGVKEANFQLVYEKLKQAHPDWDEQRLIDSAINSVWGGYKSDYERGVASDRLDLSRKNLQVSGLEANTRVIDLQNRIQTGINSTQEWAASLITRRNFYEFEKTVADLAKDAAELRKTLEAEAPEGGGTVDVPDIPAPSNLPPAVGGAGNLMQQYQGQTFPPGAGAAQPEPEAQMAPELDQFVRGGFPVNPGEEVTGGMLKAITEGQLNIPMVMLRLPDGSSVPGLDFGPLGAIMIIQSGNAPPRYVKAPNGTTTEPAAQF